MDKSTLSNYGWIVIAVLVLSVMIALSTPFGHYIKNATISTLDGFLDTEEKSLNVLGQKAKNYTHKEGETFVSWVHSDYLQYHFERQSEDRENSNYNVWKSNNKYKNSTMAASLFVINAPEKIEYSFNWSVRSESGDKLTIVVNGTTIVNGKDGINSGTETVILEKGRNQIEAYYEKDYSQHYSDDCATITLNDIIIKKCQNIETGEMQDHMYDNGKITKKETCTENGVKICTCVNCGKTKEEVVEKHQPEWDNGKVTKEQTCTENGELTYTCIKCGNKRTEIISKHKDENHDMKCDVCKNEIAGLYDKNNVLLADWDTLVNVYGLQIENDYTSSTHKNGGSLKYILENNSNLSNATKLVIPNTVTRIGNEQVYNCDNIADVVIPDSVTEIGEYAFYGCSNLTNVKMSNNIKIISKYAFYNCESLKNINISDTIEYIGSQAFGNCIILNIKFNGITYTPGIYDKFNAKIKELGITDANYIWTPVRPV